MLVGIFGALITIVKSAEKDGELHFQVLIQKTRLLEGVGSPTPTPKMQSQKVFGAFVNCIYPSMKVFFFFDGAK